MTQQAQEVASLWREWVEASNSFVARGEALLNTITEYRRSLPLTPMNEKRPRRYVYLTILMAVNTFLSEADRPLTSQEIIDELCDGKVGLERHKYGEKGSVQTPANIRRSLYQHSLRAKSPLIKVGPDRYGLREWSKEKLKGE